MSNTTNTESRPFFIVTGPDNDPRSIGTILLWPTEEGEVQG